MGPAFLRKYNTAITATTAQSIKIPMIKRGVVDFAVGADWTPAAGDVKVSKDGGAAANIATLPAAVAMGNAAYWEFVFSGAELSCGTLTVTIADSATKAVEDSAFLIETFGNASALYPTDFSVASVAQTGDNYARLGAPAGASVSADIAAVKTDTAAVKVQTDKLAFTVANQVDANVIDWKSATAPAMTGDAFARLGAPAGASVSADVAAVKTDTAAVKAQTDKLAFTVANQVDSNVIDWKGSAAPAMTGDAFARLGAPAGASVSADIAAVKSDTGTILTDVNAGAGAIFTRIGAPVGASISADVAAVKASVGSPMQAGATVAVTSNIKKNQALAKFAFLMTDSTNHNPATGKTVTVTRSIDGGAFAAGTLANPAEVANGIYTIDLGAGDLNGNVIELRATAAGCDDAFERIVTQP